MYERTTCCFPLPPRPDNNLGVKDASFPKSVSRHFPSCRGGTGAMNSSRGVFLAPFSAPFSRAFVDEIWVIERMKFRRADNNSSIIEKPFLSRSSFRSCFGWSSCARGKECLADHVEVFGNIFGLHDLLDFVKFQFLSWASWAYRVFWSFHGSRTI